MGTSPSLKLSPRLRKAKWVGRILGRRVALRVRRGARRVVNAVAPPHCPLTDEPLAEPGRLSANGWQQLNFISAPSCEGCGVPFEFDHGDWALCGFCIATPLKTDHVHACLTYDEASQPLILKFKHGDRTDLAPLLADLLVPGGVQLATPDSVLTPVPLHPRRLLKRRFNQSALLAARVTKKINAHYDPAALERVRPTPSQQSLSYKARQRNVRGAFRVRDEAEEWIEGAHIILVDDVLTTGATLSACAGALKKAGAARVDALVLARVATGGKYAI